ncbi:MAG: sensor histidine kinase [Planctomycetota bacterium]
MSIRLKVVLVIIGVMTLVFGFILAAVTRTTYQHSKDLETRMRKTMKPIVEAWVDREQWLTNRTWSDFMEKLSKARHPSLMKSFVVIEEGRGVRSSWGLEEDEISAYVEGDTLLARAIKEQSIKIYEEEGYIAVPIAVAGVTVGAIKLEVNTGPEPTIEGSFGEVFLTLALILALSTVVLIGATYLLLDRRVLNPLGLLVDASSRVAEGNLRSEVPGAGGGDEMARLVTAFNAMMREVQDYRDHLDKRVEEEKARVAAAQRRLAIAQRLAATGTLAAGIAHEVNNPLGGMINAARRIIDKKVGEGRAKEYMGLILEGLIRVQDTVKKILQFTPREVHPQPVDIRAVCVKAIDLVSHRLERKRIEVATELSKELPKIFGDPSELDQVLINLLINAVDAIEEPGGRIEIRGKLREGKLEIEIADTGSGMTEEQIQKAFDLFYTTKEVGKGTGLGLAIVHNIIENHNGRMEIRSKLGEGTTVWLQFPVISDPKSGRYELVQA